MIEFARRHPWVVLDRTGEFARRFSNRETAVRSILVRGERANWSMITPDGKHLSFQELQSKSVLVTLQ